MELSYGARFCRLSTGLRVISTRYPPIKLFDRLTPDPIALQQLTNPRLHDEIGDIALVPPDERVTGPGASYVMASFTYLNLKGPRFSDVSVGVHYAAALEIAIAETVFPFEPFTSDSADPPRAEDFRVLVGRVAAELEDVAELPDEQRHSVLDPLSYAASQAFARDLRPTGANGITYPNVSHGGENCVGAFRPRAVGIPRQERHLQYRWNGARVESYFDYPREA